jgi:hypothetical protein
MRVPHFCGCGMFGMSIQDAGSLVLRSAAMCDMPAQQAARVLSAVGQRFVCRGSRKTSGRTTRFFATPESQCATKAKWSSFSLFKTGRSQFPGFLCIRRALLFSWLVGSARGLSYTVECLLGRQSPRRVLAQDALNKERSTDRRALLTAQPLRSCKDTGRNERNRRRIDASRGYKVPNWATCTCPGLTPNRGAAKAADVASATPSKPINATAQRRPDAISGIKEKAPECKLDDIPRRCPEFNSTTIRVILGQMFQLSKDSSPMKIAVTWLAIPLIVGSANFGGAQQPSPIPAGSPVATPTPTATPSPTASPTPAATPLPPSGLRILN